MGLLNTIRRHAAIGSGDFATLFKEIDIPPLPAAINQLIMEINQQEPNIDKLVNLISSIPEIGIRVIKTVNSPLFGLRTKVTNIKHAVTLIGLKHIRSIALGYGTMGGLPKPSGDLFDHEAFWIDSLLKAMLSRAFAQKSFRGQAEEAFTASLLGDIALPVLLTCWSEYYKPIVEEWQSSNARLSDIERAKYGWDHAQAVTWILQNWDFPEEMICFIGVHNFPWDLIKESKMDDTIAAPINVAALTGSILRPASSRSEEVFQAATQRLGLTLDEYAICIASVKDSLEEILEVFELPKRNAEDLLDDLMSFDGLDCPVP